MYTFSRRRAAALLILAISLSLTAWPAAHASRAGAATALPVVGLPGYQVSVFATGTAAYSNPDSLTSDGQHVYVGYQNVTAKDGSDNQYSTIVEYTLQGKVVHSYSVLGHCDGTRYDSATHQLWALSDEDGNPHLTIINPATGSKKVYLTLPAPHGGGYDDMAFTGGLAMIDASNPSTNKAGVNVFPALDKVTFQGGGVVLTPLLMGNAKAVDLTANSEQKISLNLIDPDSLTFDPTGNLVLDNQGGSQLVFISGVGTAQPYLTALSLGTQVDDSIWPSAAQGRLLVSDTGTSTIYAVRTTFDPSVLYASTPNDSGVAGMIGTIDQISGIITPVVIGLKSPHGMLFLPDTMH